MRQVAARRSSRTDAAPEGGDSLTLTIDANEQAKAQTALTWAMKAVGLKRGVVIVMNPQTGEVLAMVSLPTYDNNLFARGISNADYERLLNDPDKPLTNHATQAHYPPGSTYKLVAGTGALADGKITPDDKGRDQGVSSRSGRPGSTTGITVASGRATSTAVSVIRATRSSSRWPVSSASTGSRTGRTSTGSVRRQASICPVRCPASSRRTSGSRTRSAPQVFPGEIYQAGIGQGYDVVTPIQLINAYAALANGGTLYQPQIVRDVVGPDGQIVRPFEPKVLHTMDVPASALKTMRNAARNMVLVRHTYNLVDLPIKVAGKSGTAEFGTRDSKGRLPFHSWFVGFVPKDARNGSFDKTDSELVVLAFAYDSRTKGNVATEIVKYYLQLHFGIKKDYRLPNLLERGNFYQSN